MRNINNKLNLEDELKKQNSIKSIEMKEKSYESIVNRKPEHSNIKENKLTSKSNKDV